MRKIFALPFLFLALVISAAPAARAQTITSPPADLWAAVPDADFVVSLNVNRILNEALPKVLGDSPANRKDLEDGTVGLKLLSGVDVHRITRAVVAGRVAGTGLNVTLQEFVVVADGEFNYGDIKNAVKGQNREMREEKYGGDTLLIFREYDDPKAKNNELIAVVMLAPNLMAGGYLNAVKRAVDAFRDGKGRASADLVAHTQSDPDALVALAARIPATYLQLKGMDASTNRLTRLLAAIKYLEAAIRLGENAFPLAVAVRTDSTDSARDIQCMMESFRIVAGVAVPDKSLVKMLDDLRISLDGNAAVVQTEISIEQIRSIVNPPKPAQTAKPDKP